MSKTLEQQLKDLQTHDQLNPDHVWVSNTREQLRMQMHSPKQTKKASWTDYVSVLQLVAPRSVFTAARSVAMFVLVIAVAIGGWGASVSASQKSLPGDLLYVVKLANEKQQVRRANTDKDRVEILLKQASTRVDELEQLNGETKKKLTPEKKKKHTEAVLASIKEKIETSSETLEKARQEKDEETIEVARVVEKETERIGEKLRGSIGELQSIDVGEQTADEQEADDAVEDVADLVEEANVKAVVVTVQTILEGEGGGRTEDEEITDLEEVKEKVVEKLQNLEKTLEEIQVDADGVSDQAETDSVPVIDTSSTTVDAVTSGTVVETTTGTDAGVPDVVVENAVDVSEQVEAVEKELKEVQELVEGDNLLEAIEKVEALYTLKNDAKEKVAEAKKTAETITETEGVVVSEETQKENDTDSDVVAEENQSTNQERTEEVIGTE